MNKKGQFFILAIILIALSMTLLALRLTIPSQVRYPDYSVNLREINDISFVRESLKQDAEYLTKFFITGYDSASEIIIKNNKNDKIDQILNARFDLPDNAMISALMLIDENGLPARFGYYFDSIGSKSGKLFIRDDLLSGESKKYTLLSNSKEPFDIKADYAVETFENSSVIIIKTGVYEATLNKDEGGAISSIRINDEEVINKIETRIVCGSEYHNQSSANDINWNVERQSLLSKVSVTGKRINGKSYKTEELFLPDRIIILEESDFSPFANCEKYELFTDLKKSILPNYLDKNGNNYVPVPIQDDTQVNSGEWSEFYDTTISLGFIPNSSSTRLLASTSDETSLKLRIIDQSAPINGGIYRINATIIPSYKNRMTNYYNEYSNEVSAYESSTLAKINFLNNISQRIFIEKGIDFLTNYSSKIVYEERNNKTLYWGVDRDYRTRFYVIGDSPAIVPITASLLFPYSIDPASIIITNEGGIIPYQLSTDNYYNHSYSLIHKNTPLLNNSFLLFGVGSFDVSFSKQAGDLSMTIYTPSDEALFYTDVTNNQLINLNTNKAGFFRMVLNGSTPSFSFNTTAEKTIIQIPLVINEVGEAVFKLNSSTSHFTITLTPLDSGTYEAELYNETSLILESSFSSEQVISHSFTPAKAFSEFKLKIITCPGRLKISAQNITGFASSQKFLMNSENPLINVVFTDRTSSNAKPYYAYYNLFSSMNIESFNGINTSVSNYLINNSVYSIDFDNLIFKVNNTANWFASGFLSCTSTSCSNSFNEIRIYEKGPIRASILARTLTGIDYIFEIYNKIPILRVKSLYSTNHSFGPEFITYGNTDNKYIHNETYIELIGEIIIERKNITNSWIGKADANSTLIAILDKTRLSPNNTVIINSNKLIVHASMPVSVDYVIDSDPEYFTNKMRTSQTQAVFNYTARSQRFEVSEELIS